MKIEIFRKKSWYGYDEYAPITRRQVQDLKISTPIHHVIYP